MTVPSPPSPAAAAAAAAAVVVAGAAGGGGHIAGRLRATDRANHANLLRPVAI